MVAALHRCFHFSILQLGFLCTGWGKPVMRMLVCQPHELVRYIYHKPLNSTTYNHVKSLR